MKRALVAALVASLSGFPGPDLSWAAGTAGSDSFSFLLVDANARSVAMGGAYTALAGGANALFYNPAGLGRGGFYEATFMQNQYFAGVTQQYAGLAGPQGWGASVNYLNSGSIPIATISNPNGVGSGSASLQDLALGAGYGHSVFEGLRAGIGAKFIRESIDVNSANAAALDLGTLYEVPAIEGLAVGAAVQNMGPSAKFQSAKENLPLNIRIGGAYKFALLNQANTVSLDVAKERRDDAVVGIGAETVIAGMMPVRVGFNSSNAAGVGVSAGVGWKLNNFSLDYAFVPFGALGDTHRFSASVRWGGGGPRAEKNPDFKQSRCEPPPFAEANSSSQAVWPYFLQAYKLMDKGRYDPARSELQTAASLLGDADARKVCFYGQMGYLALLERRYGEAKREYLQAIRIVGALGVKSDLLVADIYAGLGQCFEQERNIPLAVKAFEKSLSFNPSDRTARFVERRLRALSESVGGAQAVPTIFSPSPSAPRQETGGAGQPGANPDEIYFLEGPSPSQP